MRVGLLGTAIYIALIGSFLFVKRDVLTDLKLNELGDFVAGTTGPLAIFWLVLGFFLQRAELQQNTDALRTQSGHQETLARATREALDDTRDASLRTMLPRLTIKERRDVSDDSGRLGSRTIFDFTNNS